MKVKMVFRLRKTSGSSGAYFYVPKAIIQQHILEIGKTYILNIEEE